MADHNSNSVFWAVLIVIWADIAEQCGRKSWWGILVIIPVANFIMFYLLGKKEVAQLKAD